MALISDNNEINIIKIMSRNYQLFLLFITIFVSLAGGIVGGILVRSYVLNSSFNVPLLGDINLSSQYQGGSLVISQPKKVIVEQNERVYSVIKDTQKNTVQFYKKKMESVADDADKNIALAIKNYYTTNDIVGTGLVLTNDGWIITSLNITNPKNFVIVNNDNEIFDIEEAVFDKTTNYFLVKIVSNNLSAAQFSEKQDIADGQMVINLNGNDSDIAYVQVARFTQESENVKSSEIYYSKIKINEIDWARGSIVVTLNGAVVGLYEKDGLVTPMYQLSRLLSGFLSDKKIRRPVFGINYINLYELIGPKKIEGILISKNVNGVAVVKNSPADKAGLLANDVITEVDGRKIDQDNTFSEIIQSRRSGDEIDLTVLIGAEIKHIKVVLD